MLQGREEESGFVDRMPDRQQTMVAEDAGFIRAKGVGDLLAFAGREDDLAPELRVSRLTFWGKGGQGTRTPPYAS